KSELERAKTSVARTEGTLDSELINRVQQLTAELERDEADYRSALRLETIRLTRAVWVEGKFDEAQAEREYPLAFRDAGLAIGTRREAEWAARTGNAPIQAQLLAASDDWAWVARRNLELRSQLLTVARLADPDPWRDQVRDPALWKDRQAVWKLAEEV